MICELARTHVGAPRTDEIVAPAPFYRFDRGTSGLLYKTLHDN
ncbi:hypothetical protein ACVI1K_003622 [Bradyrhizobium sp. USDA 4508]|nr:hypothetical protein [Bradyrhizobium sp. USDA 4541]